MTVKNQEIEEAKEARRDIERKKLAEERKKYTLSQIEKDAKKDFEMERDEKALLEACDSDDGDPDVEFEGILLVFHSLPHAFFSSLLKSRFQRGNSANSSD